MADAGGAVSILVITVDIIIIIIIYTRIILSLAITEKSRPAVQCQFPPSNVSFRRP